MKLQATIIKLGDWAKKWRIKINRSKLFTLRSPTCPTVQMGNVDVPIPPEVKYLGIHLDRRLTWAKHMETESESNALATWKIKTVNRKQTPPIQSNNQTHMDSYGVQPPFQHRNPTALQSERTTVLVTGSYECGNEISG
jgi:hypothetical protein